MRAGFVTASYHPGSGKHRTHALELHNLDAMDGVTDHDVESKRPKAAAVAANLSRDSPRTQFTPLTLSVDRPEARSIMAHADFVICCVDDGAARLITAALCTWYLKPFLDIGTGVFQQSSEATRELGADIRLILPGGGCLLCAGGAPHAADSLLRLRNRDHAPGWRSERAGSLRSLNSIAAHTGIRLLEDLLSGRVQESVWLRHETDIYGIPSIRRIPIRLRPDCPLCNKLGKGDSSM